MPAPASETRRTRQNIRQLFETIDVFVTPTHAIPAPTIAELQQNPDLLRRGNCCCCAHAALNVWGLPAISVPRIYEGGIADWPADCRAAGREDIVSARLRL